MNAILANLFLLCLAVLASIGVMIYGWGLHPQSWWWILGVGLGVQAAVQVCIRLIK